MRKDLNKTGVGNKIEQQMKEQAEQIRRLQERNADFVEALRHQQKRIALIQEEIDNPRWH